MTLPLNDRRAGRAQPQATWVLEMKRKPGKAQENSVTALSLTPATKSTRTKKARLSDRRPAGHDLILHGLHVSKNPAILFKRNSSKTIEKKEKESPENTHNHAVKIHTTGRNQVTRRRAKEYLWKKGTKLENKNSTEGTLKKICSGGTQSSRETHWF